MTREEIISEVLCKSGKFETGEGTCAAICMGMLGSARSHCAYRNNVHGGLANKIAAALEQAQTSAQRPIDVRCKCGWQGKAPTDLVENTAPKDLLCPRCFSKFFPFPPTN